MNSIAAHLNVVTVPSPLVDRRALSQAWYDALHLAEHGSKGRKPTGTFREGRSIFLRSQDGGSKKSASRFFHGWKNRAFQSGTSLRRAAVQNRFERRAPIS